MGFNLLIIVLKLKILNWFYCKNLIISYFLNLNYLLISNNKLTTLNGIEYIENIENIKSIIIDIS